MKRIFSLTVFMLVCGAMGTAANKNSAPKQGSEKSPYLLPDTIVVTANRFGLDREKTLWPTTIINLKDEPMSGTLEDALDGRSGLDVRSYNGFGSLATLSAWGLPNKQMLLLYNGRAVKDYSLGGFNLAEFSTSEFDRIEILKGPQSAFYGSDAVGGVVNMISPSVFADRLEVATTLGTFNYTRYNLDMSRQMGQFGLGATAQIGSSDNARPNSASEQTSIVAKTEYISGDGRHHLTFSGRQFTDSLGAPGPVPDPGSIPLHGSIESSNLTDSQEDKKYSLDLSYSLTDGNGGETHLDMFWEKNKRQYYQANPFDSAGELFASKYWNRSTGLNLRYRRLLSDNLVAGGVDILSGSVRTDSWNVWSNEQSLWSAWQTSVDIWGNSQLSLLPSLRLDGSGRFQFIKQRRTQPSTNLGLILTPLSRLQMKLAYGYAFRLPTISEQFGQDGNPQLDPETSQSFIATLSWHSTGRKSSIELTGFRERVKSLIQWRQVPGTFIWKPANVEQFNSNGLDMNLEISPVESIRMALGGTYQNARESSREGSLFQEAMFVPDLKWRAEISGRWNSVRYRSHLAYTSDRIKRFGDVEKRIGRAWELGGSLRVVVSDNFEFSLSALDLTDRKRADQFGFSLADADYPSIGRQFIVETRVSF